MSFDMASQFRTGLPPAEKPWSGLPRYCFVGGNNDEANIPFGGLAEAAVSALRREGRSLAKYNLGGSPLGYEPLRTFVANTVGARTSMTCQADQVLLTSGSLQALDLVNELLIEPGDTVIVEQATYGGMLGRLGRCGARVIGAELDADGIRIDSLAGTLDSLAAEGIRPKYLYTIPTVQNPTGGVMSLSRRHELLDLMRRHEIPIFEDDCYADLLWEGERPPSLRALDGDGGQVIYCGSFSKSIAPALRVGYLIADWPVLAQMLSLKTDAGSGALEQLVLAEYAATHFDAHVARLCSVLRHKCEVMMEAVTANFGAAARFDPPKGGIFLWLTFDDERVDTSALVAPAAAEGIEFNPGAGWSTDADWGKKRLRLCFGHPEPEVIVAGVAALAEVFRRHDML